MKKYEEIEKKGGEFLKILSKTDLVSTTWEIY